MLIKRKLISLINRDLLFYLESNIFPRYSKFDSAHNLEHLQTVIHRSIDLSKYYNVDINMILVCAAYHDLGLVSGRDNHEVRSGLILKKDINLLHWFTKDQIKVMAQAVEDHRASLNREPRSIYGKILSDADRIVDPKETLIRVIRFGLDQYPTLTKEEQYLRFKNYLIKKYGNLGYVKSYVPQSDISKNLQKLRKIIYDEKKLKSEFEIIYNKLIK